MADNTKLLLLGGAAAAAWWFFFREDTAAVPATGSGAALVPAAALPVSLAPSSVPVSPALNSIAAIQARVLAASGNPSTGLTEDQWGWYLNNELAPLGKVAPDPVPVFGGDRAQPLTAAEYWPRMEGALRAQLGLSGFRGLGFYGLGWGRAN